MNDMEKDFIPSPLEILAFLIFIMITVYTGKMVLDKEIEAGRLYVECITTSISYTPILAVTLACTALIVYVLILNGPGIFLADNKEAH